MQLIHLIGFVKKQANNHFSIHGHYGFLEATPYIGPDQRVTYTIDTQYLQAGTEMRLEHQENFRLSTICCLCVGIVFGDKALNDKMIATINQFFAAGAGTD